MPVIGLVKRLESGAESKDVAPLLPTGRKASAGASGLPSINSGVESSDQHAWVWNERSTDISVMNVSSSSRELGRPSSAQFGVQFWLADPGIGPKGAIGNVQSVQD